MPAGRRPGGGLPGRGQRDGAGRARLNGTAQQPDTDAVTPLAALRAVRGQRDGAGRARLNGTAQLPDTDAVTPPAALRAVRDAEGDARVAIRRYAGATAESDPAARRRSRNVRLFARLPQTPIEHQCRDRFFDRS